MGQQLINKILQSYAILTYDKKYINLNSYICTKTQTIENTFNLTYIAYEWMRERKLLK